MKLRPFELALVVIFIVLALLALVLLSNYKPDQKVEEGEIAVIGSVSIWGTIPAEGINQVLVELAEDSEAYKNVTYRYIPNENFDASLLNALADNTGPDLILVSQERLVDLRRRIQPVSYETFPIRDIRNLYADGAHIWAMNDGLYGYPIAIDPLMMYWNRDIFATEGYLEPPRTWETLVNNTVPDLVQRDFDRTLRRSVVSMGEYRNVRNAFAIISALLIQSGSQLVIEDDDNRYLIRIQNTVDGGGAPLQSVADFYTRFSRPSNALYSWNRSFPEDRAEFISEDLAIYFGYASEGRVIERINPNLNFDIAEMPQGANSSVRRTYAQFYAVSMLGSARNKTGASAVMLNLGSARVAEKLAAASDMTPAHRSTLSLGSNDTFGRVSYMSASISYGWLNPERTEADTIFETMAEDINENRRSVQEAANDVTGRLRNAY